MKKIVASCLVLLFPLMASASPLPTKPHVYVEGSATVEVQPDMMAFSVELAHIADTVADAKANVDKRSRVLIDLCKKLGIAPEDIATTALRVNPNIVYEDGKQVPAGTQVSRTVDITLKDLTRYAEMMRALVAADISQTVSTRLLVSEEKSVTDQALVKAMDDARTRAERLATAQGKRLGEVYSISEFMTRGDERYTLQVSRQLMGDAVDAGVQADSMRASEPFEPGVIKATAQIYVVYLLRNL
ncbi:MAG TPA: SIMPL domain-containing protein [Cellvibrionaceae bacterium]